VNSISWCTNTAMKRFFDLIVSFFMICAVLPVMATISVLIKITDKGPVIFRQQRVGQGGRLFSIYKFRTMKVNSESKGPAVTAGNDMRITGIGKILRQTKLDELPQLVNVLKGDMSLVGPRPEVPKYVAHYPEKLKGKLLSVRPGITDWATICYRNEETLLANSTDPEMTYISEILPCKIEYYIDYIDNRSFSMDVKILIKTAWAVLFR
jgi:lipopolysaccharide/colanic/teichoic acid biosynthesis glycosyltransferase